MSKELTAEVFEEAWKKIENKTSKKPTIMYGNNIFISKVLDGIYGKGNYETLQSGRLHKLTISGLNVIVE